MENLTPQTIKIKAQIITPIHIDNGEVYDRMDYFTFDGWEEIQILNRRWLNFCAKKNKELFKKIIFSIENGDFKNLEEYKQAFYENYIEEFLEQYEDGIIKEINIGEEAQKHLLNLGNKNNAGEIKRFIRTKLNNEIFIPGSTLKGFFRTMFLFEELKNISGENYKKKAIELEKLDNLDNFKKEKFAFLVFEDAEIKKKNIEIQEIKMMQKPKSFGKSKKGVSQILETIVSGKFEIIIQDLKSQLNSKDLNKLIKNYSNILITREEQNIENIKYNSDIIDVLDNKYNSGILPIKIGMYKKSLTYKIFWEDMIKSLPQGKDWLYWARKLGVGDKTLYFDENNNSVGWIGLSNIEIIKN